MQLEIYRGFTPIEFVHDGQILWVYEKLAEGRPMITISIGRAALHGAMFGGAATAEMTYLAAPQAYTVKWAYMHSGRFSVGGKSAA